MQPGEDAHSRLRELWQDAASATTVWRMRYNMPPTDPRVLAATESDIMEDLLRLAYYDLRLQIARNPSLAVTSDKRAAQEYAAAAERAKATQAYARDIAALKLMDAKARGEAPAAKPKPPEKKKPRTWFRRSGDG